jgi:predicted transcriptional regulator
MNRKRPLSMLTARDIMTEDVVTISPEASIHDAIEILLLQEFSGLPVTDKAGQLVGILTEFALLATAYDPQIKNQPVAMHMTTELITASSEDTISEVADLCIVHRIRRVPVLEEGRLVGLIARRDVLKAISHDRNEQSRTKPTCLTDTQSPTS